MAKKVVIDEDECMGCEVCVEIVPDVFEFDEEKNIALVKTEGGGVEEDIEEAMDSCPADCITWEE